MTACHRSEAPTADAVDDRSGSLAPDRYTTRVAACPLRAESGQVGRHFAMSALCHIWTFAASVRWRCWCILAGVQSVVPRPRYGGIHVDPLLLAKCMVHMRAAAPLRQNNFKPHFGRTTLIVFYLIGATLRDILGR
jgi:hypothetical protein